MRRHVDSCGQDTFYSGKMSLTTVKTQQLAKRVGALKGHFTRIHKSLRDRLEDLEKDKESEVIFNDLLHWKQKLSDNYDKIMDVYLDLESGLEEAVWVETWQQKQEELVQRFEEVCLQVTQAGVQKENLEKLRNSDLGSGSGAGTPTAQAAAGTRQSWKADGALRPEKLAGDAQPATYRRWVRQWQDYYLGSNFASAPVPVQISYFKNCLSDEIKARVNLEDLSTLEEACDAIEADYEAQNPLLLRRLAFFRATQKKNEKFSDFLCDQKVLEQEADIRSMSHDEVVVMSQLRACVDNKLLEKLLEIENPNPESLKETCLRYETNKETSKELRGDAKHKVNKVGVNEGENGKSKVICWKCRLEGHIRDRCPAKPEDLYCKPCASKGHAEGPRCAAKAKAKEQEGGKKEKTKEGVKDKRKKNAGRTAAGSPSASSGSEAEDEHEAKCIFVSEGESCQGEKEQTRPNPTSVVRPARRAAGCRRKLSYQQHKCLHVSADTVIPTPRLLCDVRIKRSGVIFKQTVLPDTGATISCVASDIAKERNMIIDSSCRIKLRDASGKQMKVVGTTTIQIAAPFGEMRTITAVVTSALSNEILLGWRDQVKLSILSPEWPNIPGTGHGRHAAKVVRTTEEDAEWPKEWPKVMTEVLREFDDVFKDVLDENSRIKGKPMDIKVKPDAQPFMCTTARNIPYFMREAAWKECQRLVKAGIIERVDEACEWLAPAFFILKGGQIENGVRLVTDFSTGLNPQVIRNVHTFPTGSEVWKRIKSESNVFFKLDCTQGYHQVPLSLSSKTFTNFLLPWGKYRYCSAGMGLASSGDEFNIRTDAALLEAPCEKQVDDVIGQSADYEGLAADLRQVLERCREANITLSRKKVEIGTSVHYAGFIVSNEGAKPDPDKVAGIAAFPSPSSSPSKLKSFLGLAQSMSTYMPDLSQATLPLRALLKQGVQYQWLEEHEKCFVQVKKMLTSECCLAAFDSSKWESTRLLVDGSKEGVGWILTQDGDQPGQVKIVWAGSAALRPAQTRWPPIMIELLAVVTGIEACEYFLKGHPRFQIVTDHAPLQQILKMPLRDVPPRLLRLRERCLPYVFSVKVIKGVRNEICDALSRSPVFGPEMILQEDHCCYLASAWDDEEVEQVKSDPLMADIMIDIKADHAYLQAIEAFRGGKTKDDVRKLPTEHGARQFLSIWEHVGILEDRPDTVPTYDGHRIIVPHRAQKKVVKMLHIPHMGIVKTKKAAQLRYFWNGMTSQLMQVVEQCEACREHDRAKPDEPPLLPKPKAEMQPFERVGVDMFHLFGKDWLMVADHYSGFPLIKMVGVRSSTEKVIHCLKKIFGTFSYPKFCRHDGGPHFRGSFTRWLESVGVRSELSSAFNPQSNSVAEKILGDVKRVMTKAKESREDIWVALAEYRLAPRHDGCSPSEMFFRRVPRSGILPSLPRKWKPGDIQEAEQGRDKVAQERAARNTKHMPREVLAMGSQVLMRDRRTGKWDIEAEVVGIRNGGRSYVVKSNDTLYLRGIKWIKRIPEPEVEAIVAHVTGIQSILRNYSSGSHKPGKRVRFAEDLPVSDSV